MAEVDNTYIEISEDSIHDVEKYCNAKVRSANFHLIISRILRPWYARAVGEWVKTPSLVPKLEKIPESKIMKVRIHKDHAFMFKDTLRRFNERTNNNIEQASLASWLCDVFVKQFKLKELSRFKPDMGQVKKK